MKMGKKVREYKSGDFIFAKVKGYPAWPARVQKQNGKKYFVYFYGTGETANLPPNMIFDYSENKDKFLNKSVKRKDFNDGVKQIEHDFVNNVPLEQVIGALAAEADPAPADDSMNDSAANDTADDSAIADTTAADETADETAGNSTANDVPVEDSDETGALVIDEGKQKGRKSTAKTPATPKPAKEAKAPRGRPRKEEAKEVKEEEEEKEKKDEEIVSRSGRKIRPKRYMDEQTEENTTLPSPAPKKRRGASPVVEKEKPEKEKPQDKNIKAYNTVQQSELRDLKEPFKSADPEKENILIAYLPSGEYVGVKLFQSRPATFKTEASRLQWDKQAASNAITLKRQLEKGQITPQSISAQLVMDLNLTDEEKATLDKDRDLEAKKSRLHFLKTEMKLIELDAKIKTCLSLEKADTELCLKLIEEILELDLAALMLLKHPTCMETVKRMRVYVGNAPSWEMSESEALHFSKQAHRIRNKADVLFITMRDLFDVPNGLSFWEFFSDRVAQFKAVTDNLHADKLLEMVHEPIELSQPSSHTMKAAIDAANEEEATEADESVQKKAKSTPAKGKKANSTPAKTPLKRQSSRKQQQEDKEKDKEKETEKPAEDTPKEAEEDKTEEAKPESEEQNKDNKDVKENNEDDKPSEVANEQNNEMETDEADKEVEKVSESSEKSDEKEPETEDKGDGDKEKDDEDDSPKDKESNSKEKGDKKEDKPEENAEKVEENNSDEKEKETSPKDVKKGKDSEKNSNSDKNSKSKDKSSKEDAKSSKDDVKNSKDDAKNSKDSKNAKAGDKRKDKKDEKEKSEDKEKVETEEPRAKRSRESKKTEPPPRSPAKRKSKS